MPDAEVYIRVDDSGHATTRINLLLAFEKTILHRGASSICDPDTPAPGSTRENSSSKPDVLIDLAGRATSADAALILRPLFEGSTSEEAAAALVLEGRMPTLSVVDAAGRTLAWGAPSSEYVDSLTRGMEAIFSRTMALIGRALATPEATEPRRFDPPPPVRDSALVRYALRNLAMNCARALHRLCFYSPQWRIGWRWIDGPGVFERGDLGGAPWRVLADPGDHFYADPFPVEWMGRAFIFFEDFDHRTGLGSIAAIELDSDGPKGRAISVLAEPWHLSYPFIIEHDGVLWMIPESSSHGAIAIYRCIAFPHRWERCGTLVEDVEAADSTIFNHNGRFWMTSSVRDGLGGPSDMLAIYSSARLLGPWTGHDLSPALIDVSAARPAGRVFESGGHLWRPVQDCLNGYGRALRIARIDVLDQKHFRQTFVSHIRAGAAWSGGHVHTLNRVNRLECIDGRTPNPKIGALRRLRPAGAG